MIKIIKPGNISEQKYMVECPKCQAIFICDEKDFITRKFWCNESYFTVGCPTKNCSNDAKPGNYAISCDFDDAIKAYEIFISTQGKGG